MLPCGTDSVCMQRPLQTSDKICLAKHSTVMSLTALQHSAKFAWCCDRLLWRLQLHLCADGPWSPQAVVNAPCPVKVQVLRMHMLIMEMSGM